MLKILANENIPRLLVQELRQRNHDIKWVLEEAQGIADPVVLAEALADQRVLLTCDKDFGDLVFLKGKKAACGIILLRIFGTRSQSEFVQAVLPVLEAHKASWAGHFSVISRKRVRIKPLPDGQP